MNRTIISVGGAIVVVAFGLFASPIVLTGQETLGPGIESGVFVLGFGAAVILWGAASPDPRLSTVGGFFGNRDEDEVRRWFDRHPPAGAARYRPSPLESVNCETCNTSIPARQLLCPRCGATRRCRTCRKPLYFLAGAVRCGPCVKDELFCSCPKVRRPAPRGRPVAG